MTKLTEFSTFAAFPLTRGVRSHLFVPLTAALAASALTSGAHAQPSEAMGVWSRSDGGSHIRIARCGKSLCAVNTWVAHPGENGEKVGDVLVMTLAPEAHNTLAGPAYDRQRKMNYQMTLQLSGRHMTTTGCVLGGIVCRSMSWNRLGDHQVSTTPSGKSRAQTANR